MYRTDQWRLSCHLFLCLLVWVLLPAGTRVLADPGQPASKVSACQTAALTIDGDFPGGNIIVDSVKGDTVRLHRDLRDTQGDWFYWAFRVRGAQGRTLRFLFTQSACVGVRGPAVSRDGGLSWCWLGQPAFSTDRFEYAFGADEQEVRFAFAMVYTQANLERFLGMNRQRFAVDKSVLCKSRKGRSVELLRFGNPNNPNRLGVVITCRHHACEMMASYTVEGVLEEIFSGSPEGNWLRENVDFFCVPFVDKDGVEDGDQGKNRKPHDHNRDYLEKIYPEVAALVKQVSKWGENKRVMYCDFHCPWKRDGINEVLYYPGPKEPYMAEQLKKLSQFLEKRQAGGVIPYRQSFNLPFGQSWNIGTGSTRLVSMRQWAASQANGIFGATLEVPYANASGREVNAETSRQLGHSIAKAMYDFLKQESAAASSNPRPNDSDPYAVAYNPKGAHLCVSGVYPHLCAWNQPPDNKGDIHHGEAGIGALVPWAGKLWYLTYPQHAPKGSNDKLYCVDTNLHLTIEKQSLGGTHANRMIHRESNQLFMGYYAIDAQGKIRVFDPKTLVGRMTATMRHLTDPANKILFYDMEGAIYEADVHTMQTKLLFKKPFPGWHGKGAYTGQDRVVFANNGGSIGQPTSPYLLVGSAQTGPEEAGVLGQWNGRDKFEIVLQRQFTDVTGPGGIYGAASMDDPIWSMGWDKRSVMLQLLDGRKWETFRTPKSSYTFDPKHGWYTEWPRIRETLPGVRLMCMHAGLFEFPKTFSRTNTAGITPLATHLRYVPDMCGWKDKIILASDETSMQENPMCGQAQSNLWFGTLDQIRRFGPKFGWGGVWMNDEVTANCPSDPFLFSGYERRTLHVKASAGSRFVLEFDSKGDGTWKPDREVIIGPTGYEAVVFDPQIKAEWIRLVPRQNGQASAFFYALTARENRSDEQKEFDSLADVSDQNYIGGVFRPAMHNRSLQWAKKKTWKEQGEYIEIDLKSDASGFDFVSNGPSRLDEVRKLCGRGNAAFTVDAASLVVVDANKQRWRLPKGAKQFDALSLRDIREVESERFLAQMHGTFYEIPRMGIRAVPDFGRMKPIASHSKRIEDFCTWRGMLVLGGTRKNAKSDGHFFADTQGEGLWFGQIDDLWKLGRPQGQGGPWCNTSVKPNTPSDPYLMLGYVDKTVTCSHDSKENVVFTIEVNFDLTGFVPYKTMVVKPGEKKSFRFPQGYQAHWLRAVVDKTCKASVYCQWK